MSLTSNQNKKLQASKVTIYQNQGRHLRVVRHLDFFLSIIIMVSCQPSFLLVLNCSRDSFEFILLLSLILTQQMKRRRVGTINIYCHQCLQHMYV